MKPLLVVDFPKRWPLTIPGADIVSSYQYLSDPQFAQGPGRKVFNLCRSYRYQALGYYVSLLAEARGHRPLPSVSAIQDLKLTPFVKLVSNELDELIQTNLKRIKSDSFELSIYFGHNLASGHDRLSLAVFNAFPAPLLRARFEYDSRWRLVSVRVIGVSEIPESHRPFLIQQAENYLRRAPRKGREAPAYRFDLAILCDPNDPMPCSDAEAIKKFVAAGETMGIRCELIEKSAYGRIAEFDALFIRETTGVNHHTYRFARRAQSEGLVVIDDPQSILRCTNKVYLAETMARHRIATPRTLILSKDNAEEGIRSLGFPCVVKLPDSAFSVGVKRFDTDEGVGSKLEAMFENSDMLIAQEYVPTDFDWRIGVLGGKPLFACRYTMAPNHWQIVNRDNGKVQTGGAETMLVEHAPEDVVKLAVRAANLMGDGLYGVDVKVVRAKPVVIEVNDNPNIDSEVEDAALGDELYSRIMQHFFWKLESR